MLTPKQTVDQHLNHLVANVSENAKHEAISFSGNAFPSNFSNNVELLNVTNKIAAGVEFNQVALELTEALIKLSVADMEYDEAVLLSYVHHIINL